MDATTPAALEFAMLQAWLASSRALQRPLHQIECQPETKGREVQRLLLQAHLQHRGTGVVGAALRVKQEAGEVWYTHRRLRTRSLKTVFGPVDVVRMGYSRAGAPSIYPLDQTLALPARSFSYELPRRLVKAAVQNPFPEAVDAIADLTGVSVPQRSLEEILRDAAHDFDAFYRERAPEPAVGSILVAAVDGKGIPMVKPGGAQPTVRLTKGQKINRKNGHRGYRVHPRALGAHPGTGGGKPIPYPPPESSKRVVSPASGEQAGVGQFAQRQDRRHPGGGPGDATP